MRELHYGRIEDITCECGSTEIYPYEGFMICKNCGLSHGVHYITTDEAGDTMPLERDASGVPRGTYIGRMKRRDLDDKRK